MSGSPDDPRLDAALLPPFLLQTLARVLAAEGVPAERLCRGLGFDAGACEDPGLRLSFRQLATVIGRAEALAAAPALGLRVGAANVLGTLGLLGHAMSVSERVGEAIGLGLRYQLLGGGVARLQFGAAGTQAWLDAEPRHPAPALDAFAADEAFASLLVYARALAGPAFRPLRVEFVQPEPAHAAGHRERFGCPVHFAAPRNRFVVERAVLDQPLPGHQPLALRQVLALLDAALAELRGAPDLVESVERAIAQRLDEGPKLEPIAQALNLSGRTLRRRLGEQGLSFETLLEGVRRQRVLGLLANRTLALEELAARAGYRDERSFRRAVRRWTGRNPSEHRR